MDNIVEKYKKERNLIENEIDKLDNKIKKLHEEKDDLYYIYIKEEELREEVIKYTKGSDFESRAYYELENMLEEKKNILNRLNNYEEELIYQKDKKYKELEEVEQKEWEERYRDGKNTN